MRSSPQCGTGILPLLFPLFLLLAFTVIPQASFGQVAIYDLSFQRSEELSINFSSFDGGYLAIDVVAGKGSFIFTYKEVNNGVLQPFFVLANGAAEAFTAVRDSERKTVIRASAQSATAMVHYLATGKVNHDLTVQVDGKPMKVEIASLLLGQVLASDDESDVAFPQGHNAMGFAGIAGFDLTLNPDLTDRANRRQESLADTVKLLTGQLETLGFRAAGAQ